MDEQTVIKIENLHKKFCRNLKRSMIYGFLDIMRDMLGIGSQNRELRRDEFWALENINFELKKGEVLGIIGVNGSGKSTLLRLLNGIYPPDKGKITVKGKIGALIAVGAGFHPHMTGRENIYLNGTILGMTKKEIEDSMADIISFADVGEFLDAPVATYSSGMTVRLGFSIAIHCNPDILLIDEILAVGDVGFQLKCFNKIGELRKKEVSSILVSHNLHQISTFCDKLLVINNGKVAHYGNIEEGLSLYKSYFSELGNSGEIEKVITGTEKLKILSVRFNPEIKDNKISIKTGNDLEIILEYEALEDFDDIDLDIVLRLPVPFSIDYFQSTNKAYKKKIDIKKGKGILKTRIKNINLNNISTNLFITIWTNKRKENIFWWRNIPIKVEGNPLSSGWSFFDIEY